MSEESNPPLELPFSHGIEIELGILESNGNWISGEEFINTFEKIIREAGSILKTQVEDAPDLIKSKVKEFRFTEREKKGLTLVVYYLFEDKVREFDLVARDPNISRTFILEISTPPAIFLEELVWWTHNLLSAVYNAVRTVSKYKLIAVGINPTQKYSVGLSFGMHQHIGTTDLNLRLAIYNMIRNFIPHLIALSVNSPFEDGEATDTLIRIRQDGTLIAPRCIRSIRLLKNDHQLGPIAFQNYVPYMTKPNIEEFTKVTQRFKDGGRLVDLYPLTVHNTVEVRIFDTQFDVVRSIGLALILQALALKAKKIYEKDGLKGIPRISSKCLIDNREEAVSLGLKGAFHAERDSPPEFAEFIKIYNTKQFEGSDEENRYLNDAVKSMFFYIKDELEYFHVTNSPYLAPLLTSVFGSEKTAPMEPPADYLLKQYYHNDKKVDAIMKTLFDLLDKSCDNPLYDPYQLTPNLPFFLAPYRALSISINAPDYVFQNQTIPIKFIVRNKGLEKFTDLELEYWIENSFGEKVKTGAIIGIELNAESEVPILDAFTTGTTSKSYNIFARLLVGDKKLEFTKNVQVYSVESRIFTDIYGIEPDTRLDFYVEIKNKSPLEQDFKVVVKAILEESGYLIGEASKIIHLKPNDELELTANDFSPIIVENLPNDIEEDVCYIKLEIIDKSGRLISSAKSGKIALLTRPPEVIISEISKNIPIMEPMKNTYYLGDEIIFNLKLFPRGYFFGKSYHFTAKFVSNRSGSITILEKDFSSEKSSSLSFTWQIPPDLILIDEEDSFRFVFSATKDGNVIGYYETRLFTLQKPLPKARFVFLQVPSKVRLGELITGAVCIESEKTLDEPLFYRIKIRDAKGVEKIIVDNAEIVPSSSFITDFGPIKVPETEYLEVQGEILRDNEVIQSITQTINVDLTAVSKYITVLEIPKKLRIGDRYTGSVTIIRPENIDKILLIVDLIFENGRTVISSSHEVKFDNEKVITVPVNIYAPLYIEPGLANFVVKVFSNQKKIDGVQEEIEINAPLKNLFEVSLNVTQADGSPLPAFFTAPEKVAIAPQITAKVDVFSPIQVEVKISEEPGKAYKAMYPPIKRLKKNKKKNLKKFEWLPKSQASAVKVFITAKIYQNKREIKYVKVIPIMFYILREEETQVF